MHPMLQRPEVSNLILTMHPALISVLCNQGQKDLGFLMNPGEGPVTAVGLYVPPGTAAATHLFSGGADGTFAVWSAGSAWDCLKVGTPHCSY